MKREKRAPGPARFWLRTERGAVLIFAAVALVVLLGFSALVIDLGFLTLTRTQLQNAADAAALGGAVELALSDGSQAVARSTAIELAADNLAFQGSDQGAGNVLTPVIITSGDISFPQSNRIRVETHRTSNTDDPLHTYFLPVIHPSGGGYGEMTAAATASWVSVCGGSCMKPWCPPDRWHDDDRDGEFDASSKKSKGKGKGGGGGGGDYYDPELTGYNAPDDVGVQITLKLRKHNQAMLSEWYYAVDYPAANKGTPITGANRYGEWIAGCPDRSIVVEVGDTLQIEPGNMVGPTEQGVDALIALDPNARWDTQTDQVIYSTFTRSPRVVKACLFDPSVGVIDEGSGRKTVQVAKVFAFFIEAVDSDGEVTGRFLRVSDSGNVVDCGSPDSRDFLYSVRMVE
jgi:hypothetical protein